MAATPFRVLDADQEGLRAFAPEPASPANPKFASGTSAVSQTLVESPDGLKTPTVSLAGLETANVVAEWHEAVAIVQELCRVLSVSSGDLEPADLNGDSVKIDGAGNVFGPSGLQDGPSVVRQTGELLRSILPKDFPVPLRLALSQSISTPPLYSTLNSFSQALEYFERPNRRAVIQGVYRRWQDREPGRRHEEQQTSIPEREPGPESEAEPKVSAPRRASALPRQFVFMAAIVAGILGAMVAAFMLTVERDTPGAESRVDAASSFGAKAVDTVGSMATAVMERIGVPVQPPPSDAAKPAEPPVSEPVRRATPRRTPGGAPAQPISTSVQVPPGAASAAQAPEAADFAAERAANELPTILQEPSSSIYSSRNTDVVPPVAVYPQFPSPSQPRPENAPMFDIVIDSAGLVESVKVRYPPTSIGDAMVMTMSLSAAKTWRFQPAMKGGRPVRYSKTVWLPSTP